MADQSTFVIVGAGLAGAKAAEALRAEGFDGRVLLVGTEQHHPYERPPLSKAYLQGSAERGSVFVHPADWYTEQHVELRTSTTVTGIDRGAHRLHTAEGQLTYDKLLLTTGATPRPLTVPGADGTVHYLRTIDDSERLQAALRPGAHVVVVGAGWIGLEVAAAARGADAAVTVLEQAELPLLAVLGPQMARVFARLHTDHGVDLRCGAVLTGIRAGEAGTTMVLEDGSSIDADLVVAGVGVTPNVELARASGLDVDNGVVVDEHLATADPDVFAAGDVANAYHPLLRRRVRVEHWANALNQPAAAARAMLGRSSSYDHLPYFFTDQYDLGMEYIGHTDPAGSSELVVRGDLDAREFVAFWLDGGRLVAAMNVNVWTDVPDTAGRLIRSGARVDPADLADPDIPLDQLIPPEAPTA